MSIDMEKYSENGIRAPRLPPYSWRKVLEKEGKLFLSLNPQWLEQYALSKGDTILVWLEEDGNSHSGFVMNALPVSRKLLEKLSDEGYDYRKRNIKEIGSSKFIEIPKEWTELLDWRAKDKVLQLADYGLRNEAPDSERISELHDGLTGLYFGKGEEND